MEKKLSREIQRICRRLDTELFLTKKMKEKLILELEKLIEMREKYREKVQTQKDPYN